MKNFKLPSNVLREDNSILILKIVTIVAAVLAVFHQDLTIILNNALVSESMSHILIMPFLFIYLLYRKRKMLRAVVSIEKQDNPRQLRYLPTIAGIVLSTAAMLFYWHGSYTFTPLEYHMLALPIFATGITLVLFNPQTLRQLAFPLAFLAFLIPLPSEILYGLGSTLSIVSSKVSYALINSLGIPSTLTSEYGNPVIQITRPSGTTISFAVDIACSGIYSLIGFLIFAVFIAYIMRDKPWKKLTLFLIGFALIYILNIARIATILLIGYHYGEELALQLFHMLGGLTFIFVGTLVLLVFAEKILRTQIFTKPSQKCSACNPSSESNQNFCLTCNRILKPAYIRFQRTDIIKMAAIIVSVILLVSIQTPVFALTEGPAQIIVHTASGEQGNTQLLPQIQGYTLVFVYRDEDFEEIARQDASLVYAYEPLDDTEELVWVTVEIGSATSMLHPWEFCLISWPISLGQPAVATRLDLKDIRIQENPPIIARYFAFRWVETNQTEVVLYWFETARFMTNGTAQQKRLKMSLITYPDTPQNITEAEDLLPFATAITSHWQPIKTWTQISLLLSQNGAYLAAITTALLVPVTVLYALERRKQRKANAKAYKKLAKPNKQIIDAILETEKNAPPTLEAIATTHKNRTGEPIEEEKLLHKLRELEKTDIIKGDIANIRDEPTMIWKTQMAMRRPPKTPKRTDAKGKPMNLEEAWEKALQETKLTP
ncbi:MAG: exosortase/archaeosortase family protein [Candidatus Bathyarchaeota archaeon]|nr:exosortase/archaeosortase family protein [Candidatus Bathyarchaeota archaeon]